MKPLSSPLPIYSDCRFASTKKFLIIKTSSLGDIIQAFSALDYLHQKFPQATVDWVLEEDFRSVALAHPLIANAISFDLRGLKKHWRSFKFWKTLFSSLNALRKNRYDAVFDLQGNCKSAFLTLFSRSKKKVGFGWRSVREWPNLLATRFRFNVPKEMNIRLQYVKLIQMFFKDGSSPTMQGVRFRINKTESDKLQDILANVSNPRKIMVCPGSKWANKQMPAETMAAFLRRIQLSYGGSFFLIWGDEAEKKYCEEVCNALVSGHLVDRLSLPAWQNLMSEMDLVIAVDSSALHLCGTTQTRSFSIFGPTSPEIFKPIGAQHVAYQGACPYGRTFLKQCPILRSCPTGACIRQISDEVLFNDFRKFLLLTQFRE